jgi:hypothetical protein
VYELEIQQQGQESGRAKRPLSCYPEGAVISDVNDSYFDVLERTDRMLVVSGRIYSFEERYSEIFTSGSVEFVSDLSLAADRNILLKFSVNVSCEYRL